MSNNQSFNNKLLRYFCEHGYIIRVHKLLKNKPDIDISADNDMAFYLACKNGHIDLAKFLLRIKPDINISADNDVIFRITCAYGQINVAQWVFSIKPDIIISTNEAFYWSYINGHLKISNWLLQINPLIYDIEFSKIILKDYNKELEFDI